METPATDVSTELRSNWKFPAVVHFCRVFEGVLSLRQFSSDKFEAALLNPGDHSVFLSELISRLLYPGRKKNAHNPETTWPTWETNLLKKVKANWSLTMDHDPLEGQQHFVEVTPSEKLEILYLLTEIALQNSATLRDTIRNTVEDPYLTADSVRCLPIGEDADGDKYFLFSLRYEDCRLYKQSRSEDGGQKGNPEWVTVTTTLEELAEFVSDLRSTKHPGERKLHRYLSGILPEFERTERHRKKVEERFALREQAPLLKRSSRLQEQAKRKEKARGQKMKDVDMGEGKNEDGNEDHGCLDLGISRAERMRLRNQRRELAEQGLRRVLTGKKRVLEYDGLTPLGTSVQVQRKKRMQNVRPSRNITKLVSIIWEKFRRPMHHRKQFDVHYEAAKNRRVAAPQQRNDLWARLKVQQRPLEGLVGMKDARLPVQDAGRPAYYQQPSLLMNCLQQRPMRSGYSFSSLQMPRPLQNPSEFVGQRQQLQNSSIQQLMPYATQLRNSPVKYAVAHRVPVLSDSLRRPIMQPQPHHYNIDNRYNAILTAPHLNQMGQGRQNWDASRGAMLLSSFDQRLAGPGVVRSVNPLSIPANACGMSQSSLNGFAGYAASLRNVRPQMIPTQLTRSLVQLPTYVQPVMKSSRASCSADSNGGTDMQRMQYAQLNYPRTQAVRGHPEMIRATLPHIHLENGARWIPNPQMRYNPNPSAQDPSQRAATHFVKRQRND